jgi:RNA polymerase sigma factor (TIGR02999 family)
MGEVTRILAAVERGNSSATERLLPLVYDELRILAAHRLTQERPGQTLQATALVHEAFLRLVDADQAQHWDSRGHFFAAAAEAMRRILVDQARKKRSLRRGGSAKRLAMQQIEPAIVSPDADLLALDEALHRLQALDRKKAELVKLRYFAGLTIPQAAKALGISVTTANRYWAYARAWLHEELHSDRDAAGF